MIKGKKFSDYKKEVFARNPKIKELCEQEMNNYIPIYCKETYGFIFKSKNKAEWIQVLQGIDKIEQSQINTDYHDFWIKIYNYMKEIYKINFK